MKKKCFSTAFLFSLIVSVLFLLFVSCRKKDAAAPIIPPVTDSTITSPADTTSSSADTTSSGKTFLALGDSYTIGQSVDSADRFPAQTAALLSKQNIPVAPIIYIAATGWTTLNLKNAIELKNPQGTFDIVTLLIGVNDQYQTGDTMYYRSRFTDLLNQAVSLAGNHYSHVFVLSIPDYGVTPFGSGRPGVGEQIDLFNQINQEVTGGYGISYTNITQISRDDAGDNSMLANDGLHPSGKQYAQWVQLLEPKVYDVLKK